jgi:hypothetical protein
MKMAQRGFRILQQRLASIAPAPLAVWTELRPTKGCEHSLAICSEAARSPTYATRVSNASAGTARL